MNKALKHSLLVIASSLFILPASAQLSTNPYKFLGNITTGGSVEAGGGFPSYYTLWNQITCENESKWSSVEGSRGNFNWGGADNAFNYAIQHNFTHKFHALVWGAQYPGWLESLTPKERFAAITNWFNHAKEHYEELPMIDVVNEAVGMHQKGNPMIKETLGGGGKTGYDWLIKAFEMAYERWPGAILIYNDYNSIQYDIDPYIELVKTLRNAGAPIDAYGNQSHAVANMTSTSLKAALDRQQDELQMPMFITELDIDMANDGQQKAQYQQVLPTMWELPYCAGVTLWGYVLGRTWVDNSGLYKQNGSERPAMTWIKEYMQTDAAKNAVGPLPGARKEASIYIRPAAMIVAKDDVLPIKVHARMATKTIQKVELFANDELVATMTKAPYYTEYTTSKTGAKTLKAVVTATDGTTYERYSTITVKRGNKRSPYSEMIPQLPGTVNATEYDNGMSGVAHYNASRSITTATQDGQWMEYTVDVKEDGLYTMDIEVASTKTTGLFHLAEYTLDKLIYLTDFTEVPNTGSTTGFQTVHCPIKEYLTAGRHVFTLMISKGGFYVKSMKFNRDESATTATRDGQWIKYAIDVKEDGLYTMDLEVASAIAGGRFHLAEYSFDNIEFLTDFTDVPNTGSTSEFKTIHCPIKKRLTAGHHEFILMVSKGGFFINGMKLNLIPTFALPGAVEAEDLVNSNGGAIVSIDDGFAWGNVAKGDWAEYSVKVDLAGKYSYEATVSSAIDNSKFTMTLIDGDGNERNLGTVAVPNTGSINTYTVKSAKIRNSIQKVGMQTLRINITGSGCYIDKIKFICTEPVSGINEVESDDASNAPTYNLMGVPVNAGYRGIVIKNGKKILVK